MFTVTCCLLWSGNRRNRSPFSNWYSVIPSTDATLVTPSGRSWAARGSAANQTTNTVRARAFFVFRFIVFPPGSRLDQLPCPMCSSQVLP